MFESITIGNFKSCGEVVTLDFRANKSNLFSNSLYINPHIKKCARITKYNLAFGPNGSGKSNIIEAVAFFRFVIFHRVPQKGISGLANAFYSSSLGDIGSFCASYYCPGVPERITYSLKVNYRKHCLTEEMLSVGKNTIFSWQFDELGFPNIKIFLRHPLSKSDREVLISRCDEFESVKWPTTTLLNQLCSLQKDPSRLNNVDKYFRDIIDPFMSLVVLTPNPNTYEDLKDVFTGEGADIERIMKELKQLGITAESIYLEKISKEHFAEENGIDSKGLEEIATALRKGIEPGNKGHFFIADQPYYYGMEEEKDDIVFYRIVLQYENGVKLRLGDESSGNKKIINLVPVLFGTSARDDSLILIDEIDRSLHTILAKKLIKEIIDKNLPNNRQFFLTAHDPNLLDTSLLRKDELFLINIDKHASSIQKLGETGIRIDRDVKKKFIKGIL